MKKRNIKQFANNDSSSKDSTDTNDEVLPLEFDYLKPLLHPLRDLTDNWNVDISKYLELYMHDIENFEENLIEKDKIQVAKNKAKRIASFNFAQAALILQGSSLIYGKKVEYFQSLVHELLEKNMLYLQHNNNQLSKNFLSHENQDGNDCIGEEYSHNDEASHLIAEDMNNDIVERPLLPINFISVFDKNKKSSIDYKTYDKVLFNEDNFSSNILTSTNIVGNYGYKILSNFSPQQDSFKSSHLDKVLNKKKHDKNITNLDNQNNDDDDDIISVSDPYQMALHILGLCVSPASMNDKKTETFQNRLNSMHTRKVKHATKKLVHMLLSNLSNLPELSDVNDLDVYSDSYVDRLKRDLNVFKCYQDLENTGLAISILHDPDILERINKFATFSPLNRSPSPLFDHTIHPTDDFDSYNSPHYSTAITAHEDNLNSTSTNLTKDSKEFSEQEPDEMSDSGMVDDSLTTGSLLNAAQSPLLNSSSCALDDTVDKSTLTAPNVYDHIQEVLDKIVLKHKVTSSVLARIERKLKLKAQQVVPEPKSKSTQLSSLKNIDSTREIDALDHVNFKDQVSPTINSSPPDVAVCEEGDGFLEPFEDHLSSCSVDHDEIDAQQTELGQRCKSYLERAAQHPSIITALQTDSTSTSYEQWEKFIKHQVLPGIQSHLNSHVLYRKKRDPYNIKRDQESILKYLENTTSNKITATSAATKSRDHFDFSELIGQIYAPTSSVLNEGSITSPTKNLPDSYESKLNTLTDNTNTNEEMQSPKTNKPTNQNNLSNSYDHKVPRLFFASLILANTGKISMTQRNRVNDSDSIDFMQNFEVSLPPPTCSIAAAATTTSKRKSNDGENRVKLTTQKSPSPTRRKRK